MRVLILLACLSVAAAINIDSLRSLRSNIEARERTWASCAKKCVIKGNDGVKTMSTGLEGSIDTTKDFKEVTADPTIIKDCNCITWDNHGSMGTEQGMPLISDYYQHSSMRGGKILGRENSAWTEMCNPSDDSCSKYWKKVADEKPEDFARWGLNVLKLSCLNMRADGKGRTQIMFNCKAAKLPSQTVDGKKIPALGEKRINLMEGVDACQFKETKSSPACDEFIFVDGTTNQYPGLLKQIAANMDTTEIEHTQSYKDKHKGAKTGPDGQKGPDRTGLDAKIKVHHRYLCPAGV